MDDGHGLDQQVPFCSDCLASIRRKRPQMPKFSLANDLWLGQLPEPLRRLSEGAWLMLALARPFIHRINCYPDGQTRGDPKELYKGFIGNVAAFKQQDGASLLTSLPPRAADLAERIAIAFVGNSGELHKCHVEALQCSVDDVRSAYNLLRCVNATYADVEWDEVAADALSREGGALGLPETLQGCVGVPLDRTPDEAKVTLEGPADAVVEPLVGQPGEDDDTAERGATVVGCAEEDIADDTSQHALRTKQLLLQQLDRDIENQKHEAEMRKSVPTFVATEARNELKERGRELQKEIKQIGRKV